MVVRLSQILAIDPGLRATGYAYFRKGRLVRAGLKRCQLVERAEIAAAIGRDLAVEFVQEPLDALVVEVPQVYQPRLMKGDPNDLVSVALVAGAVLQLAARVRLAVSPHQWKGNVKKTISHNRIMLALTAVERDILANSEAPASLQHNVLDAVGIGKWYLNEGRKGKRR